MKITVKILVIISQKKKKKKKKKNYEINKNINNF